MTLKTLPLLPSTQSVVSGARRLLFPGIFSASLLALAGCGSAGGSAKKTDFFTSGSREADQRASQQMAKNEQLTDSGEGAGEPGAKKAKAAKTVPPSAGAPGQADTAAKVEGKLTLFDRLGGEAGIQAVVEDFTPRVLQDPRVNWTRQGAKTGMLSFMHGGEPASWQPSPENLVQLKRHLAQFIALATGGPAHYDGKEIKSSHAGMHITNPEFDAALGDLKASLDRLQIANQEQRELLSIIESTRPQIVTER